MSEYSCYGLRSWYLGIFMFMMVFYSSVSVASEEKTTIVTVVIDNKAPTCAMYINNNLSSYTYKLGILKLGTTIHPVLDIKVLCASEAFIGVKAGVVKGALLPGNTLVSMHAGGNRIAGDAFVLGLKDGYTGNRITLTGDDIFCSGIARPNAYMSCMLHPETIIKPSSLKGDVRASIKFTAVYN
ncbi:hypothetical protein EVU22_19075 [Salmonella enterica subsp. enterica serovar Mbandaka]|nr:hypothetical protein [Salmonella enterica subsp. enterica serovar Mbandaka]